jgi:hypothetical protein
MMTRILVNTKQALTTLAEVGLDGRCYAINIACSFVSRLRGRAPGPDVAVRIKQLAATIDKSAADWLAKAQQGSAAAAAKVTSEAHAVGVPVRHLGEVFAHCQTDPARTLVATEMSARVCRDLYLSRAVLAASKAPKGSPVGDDGGDGDAAAANAGNDASADVRAALCELGQRCGAADGSFLKAAVFPLFHAKYGCQAKLSHVYVNSELLLRRIATKLGLEPDAVLQAVVGDDEQTVARDSSVSDIFVMPIVRRGLRVGAASGNGLVASGRDAQLPPPSYRAVSGGKANENQLNATLGPKAPPAMNPTDPQHTKHYPVSYFYHTVARDLHQRRSKIVLADISPR